MGNSRAEEYPIPAAAFYKRKEEKRRTIKVEMNNGKAEITTPYNPDFVKAVRKIGGAKWDGEKKCWTIPGVQLPAARMIMEDIYGYSDLTPNETVTVKATFHDRVYSCCSDVTLFGKVLAHAYGRDSGVKIGDDVSYVSGAAASGGSVRNWLSIVEAGSVVILTNVNKSVYEKEKAALDSAIEVGIIETEVDKKSLMEEKERLLKRIDEINKLLLH